MISAKHNALRHVAIIMDGNGRWAKSKLKPRIFGHRNSILSIDASIDYCVQNNVEILTLFAFGMDNWSRPEQEVLDLMDLFYKILKSKTLKLHKNNVLLKVVGDKTNLSPKLLNMIDQSELHTQNNTGLKLQLAVDYSGQWDIVQAVKSIAKRVSNKELSIDDIDKRLLEKSLLAGDVPVDLLIRTSNEVRLSDFMLWQLAYAEMYFTTVMWPDFSKKELQKAVQYFYSRQRRFGKTSEQV